MGKIFDRIDDKLKAWIGEQPMWFVATAPLDVDGHVNLSPRGHDSFSIIDDHTVAWVDYTGSGVETIAHLRENGRVCIMFTSFDSRPRIVRLHGRGSVSLPGEAQFERVVARHPNRPSTRAVITVDVTRISDSCGWGVPVMAMTGERDLLRLQPARPGTRSRPQIRFPPLRAPQVYDGGDTYHIADPPMAPSLYRRSAPRSSERSPRLRTGRSCDETPREPRVKTRGERSPAPRVNCC